MVNIEINLQDRQTGKTTKAVRQFLVWGYSILIVHNNKQRDLIIKNIKILEPTLSSDVFDRIYTKDSFINRDIDYNVKNVIIDDFYYFNYKDMIKIHNKILMNLPNNLNVFIYSGLPDYMNNTIETKYVNHKNIFLDASKLSDEVKTFYFYSFLKGTDTKINNLSKNYKIIESKLEPAIDNLTRKELDKFFDDITEENYKPPLMSDNINSSSTYYKNDFINSTYDGNYFNKIKTSSSNNKETFDKNIATLIKEQEELKSKFFRENAILEKRIKNLEKEKLDSYLKQKEEELLDKITKLLNQ